MRSPTPPTRFLMLFACASVASACAPQVEIRPLFPPSADLAVEPKPVPPPEIVTSAQAAAEYDIAVEVWGERGWRAVARICRWAREKGAGGECPGVAPR